MTAEPIAKLLIRESHIPKKDRTLLPDTRFGGVAGVCGAREYTASVSLSRYIYISPSLYLSLTVSIPLPLPLLMSVSLIHTRVSLGGEKYCVNDQIFKFASDWHGIYGGDRGASKAAL